MCKNNDAIVDSIIRFYDFQGPNIVQNPHPARGKATHSVFHSNNHYVNVISFKWAPCITAIKRPNKNRLPSDCMLLWVMHYQILALFEIHGENSKIEGCGPLRLSGFAKWQKKRPLFISKTTGWIWIFHEWKNVDLRTIYLFQFFFKQNEFIFYPANEILFKVNLFYLFDYLEANFTLFRSEIHLSMQ